jgi:serine/threonine protein phosphatase PrpC
MKLHAAGATHAGKIRTVNQDRWLVIDQKLFVVADGMGGHRGGEVAAQLTVNVMGADKTQVDSSDALAERVAKANQVVLEQSRNDPELSGMGTTITAVAVLPDSATLAGDGSTPTVAVVNVGDSRTYRMRAGELEQLTEDHNVTSELVRTGRITADEARNHRQRSVLTRAIGVDDDVESDVLEVLVGVDDRFLLCSDGLYTEVPDDVISSLLRRLGDPQEAANELVRTAVSRGGRDNVTAIVVDIVDDNNAAYIASQRLGAAAHQSDDDDLNRTIEVTLPINLKADSSSATQSAATAPPVAHHRNVPSNVFEQSDAHFETDTMSEVSPSTSSSPSASSSSLREPFSQATGAPHLAKPDTPTNKQTGLRRPFLINLRVLFFFGLLFALAVVVGWAIKQRDKVQDPSTTVPVSVQPSTSIAGPAIPTDSEADPEAVAETDAIDTQPPVEDSPDSSGSTPSPTSGTLAVGGLTTNTDPFAPEPYQRTTKNPAKTTKKSTKRATKKSKRKPVKATRKATTKKTTKASG